MPGRPHRNAPVLGYPVRSLRERVRIGLGNGFPTTFISPLRTTSSANGEMIARMWRGWTRPEDLDAYVSGLRKRIKDQVGMPGKVGSILLARNHGDRSEVVTISFWDSLDAVRVLAGDRIDRAVFFPLDDQYLIDRETTVAHFEVAGAEGIVFPTGSRAGKGVARSGDARERSGKRHAA